MRASIDNMTSTASDTHLQAAFLALVPVVRRHGQVFFRHLKCHARREDAIAEMVALCWRWFLRLKQRGQDPAQFPSALASFAARAVRSGRRLAGMDRPKDLLSPLAQLRHGFSVCSIPAGSTLMGNLIDQALQDNRRSPIPEQVSFRLDFPAWVRTRTARDRWVIADLMVGERTMAVAAKYGLTAGRVSQLRRNFLEDWIRFCEDPAQRGQTEKIGQLNIGA